MEVTDRKTSHAAPSPLQPKSSFDCDPAIIDTILDRRVLGERLLRIDAAKEPNSAENRSFSNVRRIAEVKYATSPSQEPLTRIVRSQSTVFEIDETLRRERLYRLLDQQQAWYDAAQQAAQAADQLLQLYEHHQQPWIHKQIPT